MVKIRLARFGKKKSPTYRIVVSDAQKDTLGTYIESLGTYNPSVNPKVITINNERAKHWLSVGAQPSTTVHNLLVSEGILEASKIRAAKYKKPEAKEEPAASTATEKQSEVAEESTKEPEQTEENTADQQEEKAE